MSWQPTLRGQRVWLRPLAEADHEALFAAAADPEIWRQHPSSDRYQRAVFDRFFAEALASRGALLLSRPDGSVIGSSRFTNHRADTRSVEIGYTFLIRACWGDGSNAELKRLMLEHAFAHVDTVWFVVGPDNLRSRRAMEKIGGVLTSLDQVSHVDGRHDKVFYRIERRQSEP